MVLKGLVSYSTWAAETT